MKRITRKGCWVSATPTNPYTEWLHQRVQDQSRGQGAPSSAHQPSLAPSTSSVVICAQQVSICPSHWCTASVSFPCLWRLASSAGPRPRHPTTSCQPLPSALDTLLEQQQPQHCLWATVVRPPRVLNLQLSLSQALLGACLQGPGRFQLVIFFFTLYNCPFLKKFIEI